MEALKPYNTKERLEMHTDVPQFLNVNNVIFITCWLLQCRDLLGRHNI